MSFLSKVLLTAAATVAAGSASAATVSFTHNTGNTNTPIALSIPFTDTFTLPGFDTTLGTLTGINITLSTTATVIAQVTGVAPGNGNGNSGPFAFTGAVASLPVNLTGPGGVAINATVSTGPFSGSVNANQTVNAGSTTQTLSNSQSVASANFSAYTSSQNVSLTFASAAVTASGVGVPNRTFFGGDGNATGTITVAYTYNPASTGGGNAIPEPASMALLGAGLLGLGLTRRRRA